jgi:hypothetical protein
MSMRFRRHHDLWTTRALQCFDFYARTPDWRRVNSARGLCALRQHAFSHVVHMYATMCADGQAPLIDGGTAQLAAVIYDQLVRTGVRDADQLLDSCR